VSEPKSASSNKNTAGKLSNSGKSVKSSEGSSNKNTNNMGKYGKSSKDCDNCDALEDFFQENAYLVIVPTESGDSLDETCVAATYLAGNYYDVIGWQLRL
jgi:hypothetical protein